jgi:calcineurin-like phosphoesterase family protein
MTVTYDQLRTLYLEDLKNPDVHHGRTTAKVKNPSHWENIQPRYNVGRTIPLSQVIQTKLDGGESPNVWIWSDIHLGHKNIMKYSGRPFPSADLMNQCLIGNHANVVQEHDIVLWLGDIGFMSENAINGILDHMPGYNIHIYGNHDMHRDGKLYNLTMEEQHLCYPITLNVAGIELQLLLTHYPMDTVPKGCVSVHGHIHQHIANPWNINVCVEHTGYAPLNIMSVVDRARDYLIERV